jgi:hypothetical protein
MNTRILLPGILTIVAALLSGCGLNVIQGSGHVITETRPVSDFSRVELLGSGEVVLTQDDQESLTVEAEDNLMSRIRTEVRGHTLYLSLDYDDLPEIILPTRTIRYHVSLKTVEGLTLSGSGNIRAEQLKADVLDMTISGSGNIILGSLTAKTTNSRITGSGKCEVGGGTAQTQTVVISGSGDYDGEKLAGETITVRITGSGKARVWAQDTLEAHITGSGDVVYSGTPHVTELITGSGRVWSESKH